MNKFLKFGILGLLSAGLAVPAFAQGSAAGEATSRAMGGYNGGGPYTENPWGPGGQYERHGNYEPGYQTQGRQFQNEQYGAQNNYGPPQNFNPYNGGQSGYRHYGPENPYTQYQGPSRYGEGNGYGQGYGPNENFGQAQEYSREGNGMGEAYNGSRGYGNWEGGYNQGYGQR